MENSSLLNKSDYEVHIVSFETVSLNSSGGLIKRFSARVEVREEPLGNDISLSLVHIPAGVFQMGSRNEGGYADEMPLHPAYVSSFWLGRAPVTQAQWRQVMHSLPPCRFHDPDLPVETINWMEADQFCRQLSKLTGRSFTLPSETHWEYACRAGTRTPFNIGDTITTDYVNYVGEHTYRDGPQGVYRHGPNRAGDFAPNPWGLFDMHGNVWEFCQDSWCDDYTAAPVTATARIAVGQSEVRAIGSKFETGANWLNRYWNGRGQGSRSFRVARGGSWHETPMHCRSAARLRVAENERLEYYGLRVMLLED